MKHNCPNQNCPGSHNKKVIAHDGFYFRKNDSRKIRRFRCTYCGKRFSQSTSSFEYRQKKRRVNYHLYQLLSSCVSMRRAAKILNVNKKTVARKLIYLSEKMRYRHLQFLKSLREKPVTHVQFDDLITIEHTKLKPLAVTIVTEVETGIILDAVVSQIPAFGKIAKKSVAKYGYRKSNHFENVMNLFENLKDVIAPNALIETDEHSMYSKIIKHHFPLGNHLQYKGRRGSVSGQGELKKIEYDPLFAINHSCAMFRANISRLVRKTWCTTKKAEMLQRHIDIYIDFHNRMLKR